MSSNFAKFEASRQAFLAEIIGTKAPSINEDDPHWSEMLDVKEYLTLVARAFDEHVKEVATLASMNASMHGIDVRLAENVAMSGLDGNLLYDIEQEAIALRASRTYRDTRDEHRIGSFEAGVRRAA